MIIVISSFSKSSTFKFFCPHESRKPTFSYSSGLESVFEKLRSRDESKWTVDGPLKYSYVFKFTPV